MNFSCLGLGDFTEFWLRVACVRQLLWCYRSGAGAKTRHEAQISRQNRTVATVCLTNEDTESVSDLAGCEMG